VNVVVKAPHMDVTDAIRKYVETKVGKLPRFYDNIMSIDVTLDIEADMPFVEIVVAASRKNTFVASHRQADMYAAIDQCLHKISVQLRRHKDKVRDRHSPAHGEAAEQPDHP